MRPAILLASVMLVAACSTTGRPYDPVETVRYSAIGHDPFWTVTIGDDSIVLALGMPGDEGAQLVRHDFPRTLPRRMGGVRTWESESAGAVISIETRPGPCTASGGLVLADHVRVRLSGRELGGCGGPPAGGGRG